MKTESWIKMSDECKENQEKENASLEPLYRKIQEVKEFYKEQHLKIRAKYERMSKEAV